MNGRTIRKGAPVDERVAITKECIRTAFFQQLRDIGFQRINIRSLAAKAGVNRSTFYLHYADKYDLLNQVEDELLQEIRQTITDTLVDTINLADKLVLAKIGESVYGGAVRVLSYIREHRFEFSVLVGPNGDPGFAAKYGTIVAEIISGLELPLKLPLPSDYLVAIVSGAHINVIRAWIARDMRESPEELAALIGKVVQSLMKSLFKLRL